MGNFDYKKYLVENKLTAGSRLDEDKFDDKITNLKKYTYTLNGKKVTPEIGYVDHLLKAMISTPRSGDEYFDYEFYRIGEPDESGNIELSPEKGKKGMYTEEMANNFDLKKYLVENKLTAGSRLNEETQNGTTYLTIKEPLTKAMAAIGYKKTIVGKSEFSPLSFARPLNTKSVLEVRVSPAPDKGEIVLSKGVGEEESKVDYPVIMFIMYPNSIENPSPPQESTNFIVRPTYIDLSKYTTEEAVNKITRLVKEFDNESNID